VEQAAREVSESDAEAVDSALDDLEDAAADLPEGSTPAEVRAALEPSVTELRDAFAEMRDGIQCS
jgi:hypothetical protein